MHKTHSPPSTGRLLKATGVALAVAAIVLVTTVLPAEYGIDPTGIGSRLGLDALAGNASAAELPPPSVAPTPVAGTVAPADTQVATEAVKVFGAEPGQTFDTQAVSKHQAPFRRDTMSLTLQPGEGAEIKAQLASGDAFLFHWTASGDVAVDMHGERSNAAKDEYTSYSIELAQREASGQLLAPFDGRHGWYWLNRGPDVVTVQVEVAGFQQKLFRPGH